MNANKEQFFWWKTFGRKFNFNEATIKVVILRRSNPLLMNKISSNLIITLKMWTIILVKIIKQK